MISWSITDDYLYGQTKHFKPTCKIGSFDLDGTLIKTKSKKRFPLNAEDWKWYSPNVCDKLQKLASLDYCIIIISNQAGLKTKHKVDEWMQKINDIHKIINIELMIFCSLGHNKYRKPLPTFFYDFYPDAILAHCDFVNSFYCGDACGRKNDHSDVDLKFAKNCFLKFCTPEILFDGVSHTIPQIDYPIAIHINSGNNHKHYNFNKFFSISCREMIIMVGYPGSGKSTVARELNKQFHYNIINQDTVGTKPQCKKIAQQFMSSKQSIVIDSTNSSKTSRQFWINLARDNKYRVRLIIMTTSKELSLHNNHYRSLITGKLIPTMVYNVYDKHYEEPTKSEGIDEIIQMDYLYIPDKHPHSLHYMYYMYLY